MLFELFSKQSDIVNALDAKSRKTASSSLAKTTMDLLKALERQSNTVLDTIVTAHQGEGLSLLVMVCLMS